MWDDMGMGIWMVFMMGGFWILILGCAYLMVFKVGPASNSREPTPLDMAKGRYARGEISREDYERLRSDLA